MVVSLLRGLRVRLVASTRGFLVPERRCEEDRITGCGGLRRNRGEGEGVNEKGKRPFAELEILE